MITASRRLLSMSIVALWMAACGAPQASQSSSSAQPVAVGTEPCDNLYFPIKAGATWTYAAKSNTVADFTVVETITNVGTDSFTQTIETGDGVTQTQSWTCTKEGLVQQADGVFKGPDGTATVTSKSNTGVTFLRNPKPGDTWTQAMESEIKGSGISVNTKSTSTFKAIGMESVTVPVGTFDALRIDMTTESLSTFADQQSMPATGKTSMWLVRGKGVVKTTSDTGSITSETALKSFQIS